MYCDLCDNNFCNYYYKRHINTEKHIKNLKILKEKIDEKDYNIYINTCYNNCKTKKYKLNVFMKIKRGKFYITL
jgi:uncharacterized FAD-dependent dehydrogenase